MNTQNQRARLIRDRICQMRLTAERARHLATSAAKRDDLTGTQKWTIAADTCDSRADKLEHILRSLSISPASCWKE